MPNPFQYPVFTARHPTTNVPLVGGKVYFYDAGTTDAKDTYSDSTLLTANTNPVILDANGEATIYLSGSYKVVLDDADDVQVWSYDNITAVEELAEWTTLGAATYVSATSFTVSGDQTSLLHNGRRVRLADSSTLYATVTASVYGVSDTTVTVVTDSGSVTNSLTSVSYGIISADNTSVGFLQSGTGAKGRSLDSKLQDIVYVEDFGAVGNGSTDDAAAIQAAIDAAPSGGTVFFQSKNYLIKSRLSISQAITLQGSTQFATSILCFNTSALIINLIDYVQLKNLEFAASVRHTSVANTYIGIEITGTTGDRPSNHIYRDIYLDGFKTGIEANWFWSNVLDNVNVNNGAIGIRVKDLSVNNVITNSTFGGDAAAGSRGIYLDGATVATEGWMISDTLIDNYEIAIYGVGATYVYIDNCILDHCYSNGINIVDNGTNFGGDWTIRGSYIGMSGTADAGIKGANAITNSQNRGNIITDNQLLKYSGATCAYGIYMSGAAAINNIISGNTLDDFGTSDIRCNTGPDIVVNNNCQSTVTNNLNVTGDSIVQNNIGDIAFKEFSQYQTLGQNKVTWSYTIPTTGTWTQGDICYKSNVAAGGKIGWVCTTGGTSGTWKAFGVIDA